jgi:hypothetical protein
MTRDDRRRWRLALIGMGVVGLVLTLGAFLRADREAGPDRVLGFDAQGRLYETTRPIPGLRALRVTRQLSAGQTTSITVGLDLGSRRSR